MYRILRPQRHAPFVHCLIELQTSSGNLNTLRILFPYYSLFDILAANNRLSFTTTSTTQAIIR